MAGVLGLGGGPGRFAVCPAYAGAPAAFGGEEFPEGGVDLIPDNVIMGDVDVGEDGLVELPPCGVAGVQVELVGVLEQVEVRFKKAPAAGEVIMHVPELFGESCPVAGDGPEPFADAFLWQGLVGGEVEQVVFFHGECLELVLKLLAVQPLRRGLIGEGAFDEPLHRSDESRAEL
ncbi:hypothetical protein AS96_12910 [Microbacterium sp. MRS-1]|uniref:Uncharacterized protein n=1 Tax=Candidatus Microsaccharimonas sossegonensis TaxID=2506948 RepID=A0A4Q0AHQ2_9BACT|nr:hypothetical protein [Microbacterium sp. MRS-1]EXJ50807.1 hypothetical protein AS96_12910 [Microbacterium sp. MRS-1]RWZ78499.1 MAG: hypothetical protein EOT05_01970 [Candidatus Microsaccharimonas sossegonensis]